MPTITPLTQLLMTARQAESLEWMQELAKYDSRLAIPGLPHVPTPTVIKRCPRFAPNRHKTPAPFDLLLDWRDNLAQLAKTAAQKRIVAGATYRYVLKQGHRLYAPSGLLLCTVPPAAPAALREALFAACVAHQRRQQIII